MFDKKKKKEAPKNETKGMNNGKERPVMDEVEAMVVIINENIGVKIRVMEKIRQMREEQKKREEKKQQPNNDKDGVKTKEGGKAA